MAWRYSRRVTVFPGIKLNIGKNGISTTIGVPGANINIGKNGVFLNTGIPGTGFYSRTKLNNVNNIADDSIENPIFFVPKDIEHNISSNINEITSDGLKSLKDIIDKVIEERSILTLEIDKAKNKINETQKILHKFSWIPLVEKMFKTVYQEKVNDVNDAFESLQEIERQLKECQVDLNFTFENKNTALYYKELETSFSNLQNCNSIWNIVNEREINRVKTRSSAKTEIDRVKIRICKECFDFIKYSDYFPVFINSINEKLVFLPAFIIKMSDSQGIALIEYKDLVIEYIKVIFIETENIPPDSNIDGYTWLYVNKNGQQDMRYANNYQIPVMKYSKIKFITVTGMIESFMFSNEDKSYKFADILYKYVNIFNMTKNHENNQSNNEERKISQNIKMKKSIRECFEILGLTENASPEKVRQAFLILVQQYHPDKVSSLGPDLITLAEEKTRNIIFAYETIMNQAL